MSNANLSYFCETCKKTRRMRQHDGQVTCPACYTSRTPKKIQVPDPPPQYFPNHSRRKREEA